MHRLFIVLPVYAAVVIFLPRQEWFLPVMDYISRIHPDIAFWTSMLLSAAGILALWVFYSRPTPWMARHPRVSAVIASGFMGFVFAGVFDLFERLAGNSTTLYYAILMPIGFMAAEGIWLAVQWRMGGSSRKTESADTTLPGEQAPAMLRR
jgi:hypothetical protein